jgi:sigma-B regulation protein RsbU (phosphoserine phosphatase)
MWQAARATLAERQMEVERDRTRLALTQQVAERLDGDLRRIASVGHVLAATLAERDDWTQSQLDNWVRVVLAQDERIFGQALAFEPFKFDPQRENYCLYAYREGDAIRTKQLLPPDYMPLYREWSWYREPLADKQARWSEPYVDTGGGDVPMVTYSTPMTRRGETFGVLTLDLSVEYFAVLREWLAELDLGSQSYGFIVSDSGVIVSHPDSRFDFAQRVAKSLSPRNMREYQDVDPAWSALVKRFGEESSGTGMAIAPATGQRSQIHFARVPSAKWAFVAIVAEEN